MHTQEIKALIFNDRNMGMSYGEIGKKYDMPKSTVQHIVQNYNKFYKKRGPKERLSKADKRRIKMFIQSQYDKNVKCSLPDVIKEFNLNASTSTVCRSLKAMNFKYKRLPYKFHLTYHMRQKRVQAARAFITNGIPWNKVIFSDEKLFTLHGSDTYYAWLDKNMSPRRVRQVVRSAGLMIWAMIMPNGLVSYQVMKGRQKSADYINILKTKAIPIIKLNCQSDFIFQMDNCPIHVSKLCQDFFRQSKINILDWPSYSPDMNIMENIWAYLSKEIYNQGPLKNLRDLQWRLKNVVALFNETQSVMVKNLYQSITTRLCLILEKRGQRLKY